MVSWTGFENIVRQGEPLAMHTWFQLGGPAEYFAEPENPDQLIALLRRSHEEGVEARVLGQGSNVLIRDEGVPGWSCGSRRWSSAASRSTASG